MAKLFRGLFFLLIVKPLALLVLGLNVRNRERLPVHGPAILVSNHNSHLDTVILASLFPLKLLPYLRPVAAADYFFKNRFLAWYSRTLIGVVGISRSKNGHQLSDPFADLSLALQQNSILLFFPEGTRGVPEQMGRFRTGIAKIAQRHPDIPIYPIFIHGSGKSLPRNEGILVPFCCDLFIGEPRKWGSWKGSEIEFAASLEEEIRQLPGETFMSQLK
jgi:1-acyl-sn-glycerol-3-phosphate acyltransferase